MHEIIKTVREFHCSFDGAGRHGGSVHGDLISARIVSSGKVKTSSPRESTGFPWLIRDKW